ncbi:MAG: sulfatase-like hydrolase/transferase [Gemmatimonadota bacterium]|nr:sulfatase-like hydrolase/transferase [Gemmatimonadota bacterium]
MPTAPASSTRPAAAELPIALRLAAGAWAVMALQELALFLRPTPYGGPYVHDAVRYLGLALLYNLLAVGPVSLPFILRWWVGPDPGALAARAWHRAQLACLVLILGLDHIDNEVMRFLGTHLSLSLVQTYGRVGAWGADMWHIFATDRGGPWVPFAILAAGMGGLWWWGSRLIDSAPRQSWTRSVAAACTILPVVLPFLVYISPGGKFPRSRVRPAVIKLLVDARRDSRAGTVPGDLDRLAQDARLAWRAGTADSLWQFGDSAYPLWRTPAAPGAAGSTGVNFIYLQLETFRGWNVGQLNPGAIASATPFLDSLATAPASAWWSRALSFGPPTPNGFFAGHCSAPPHSRQFISTVFTTTRFLCLPELLRRHGYRAMYFTGSDPDWDNQSAWLRRWYDSTAYYRDAQELDREIFRRAARRIRELGRGSQPFLATVVSISNHYPFRSREPALDISPDTVAAESVRNTMRYTDEVVREFVDSLRQEPWFGRTVLIVVGDHGYNLGEHDGTAGQRNGWRESNWVPLIVRGAGGRLPPGRHDEPASLLDVAPTVADLAGIRDPVAWLGRSLLEPATSETRVSLAGKDATFAETQRWSLVRDPDTGAPRLYEAALDPLQQRDLSAQFPDTAARLLDEARERQALWDYLVEANRVTPPAGERETAP